MQIIEKPIGEIIPYENNPRKNDKAVPLVANSIKEFGFKVPIIIDKDNVIVAGHTRLKAALSLNMATVPCIIADDLTEAQIKAFRLADNKVAEQAEWDLDLLSVELDDLLDFDMEEFGFDIEDDAEAVEDEYEPVIPEEPKSQKGHIYIRQTSTNVRRQHRPCAGENTNGWKACRYAFNRSTL